MKTIYLKNDDICAFVDEICTEVEKGNTVEISMYGYRAYAYPNGSRESIRKAIIRKLKAIKRKEENLQALKKHSNLSDEQIRHIALTHSPEDIEDTCFECGIYSSIYCGKTL